MAELKSVLSALKMNHKGWNPLCYQDQKPRNDSSSSAYVLPKIAG
jgi:hypothetical protein